MKTNQHGGNIDNMKNKIDNVHFWSNQMREHSLFLHLGVEEDLELKKNLKILHDKWENLLVTTFEKDKKIDRNKIFLDDADFAKLDLNNFNFEPFMKLLNELEDKKNYIKGQRESGKWLGWIYISFIIHILRELHYLKNILNDKKFSDQETIDFWNLTNGEHAGLTGQLLDPDIENDLEIKKAHDFHHEFLNLSSNDPEKKQFLTLSIKKGTELNDFLIKSLEKTMTLDNFQLKTQEKVHDNKIKSIIHPVLIDHEVREGKRSIKVLEMLTQKFTG
ncbi:Domain of unknown function (DUF2935)-containing protein [uncultured virus]|nr:Domain of unknown function (DUF2935)-containing protein [uncultured virus]